jgi:hypothetical protein
MGEFHFSRYNCNEWRRELAKMKAGGITVIASYLFWIHHEECEGDFNFDGNNDLRRFVEECRALDLDVFLRIGPWAHGECRNGGFPDWLLAKPLETRTNDENYLPYVRRLYEQVYAQIRGLQYSEGGNIIGIQIDKLRYPNACGVHDLQHGFVPDPLRVCSGGLGKKQFHFPAGQDLGKLLLAAIHTDLGGDRRFFQETGRNQIKVEVLQTGKTTGQCCSGSAFGFLVVQIIADIQLRCVDHIDSLVDIQPLRKLANITHIGCDCVVRRMFYLLKVILICLNQIQHGESTFLLK